MVRMYKCPRCGRPMYKKDRRDGFGQFFTCEHCGYMNSDFNLHGMAETANFNSSTINRCPRCGGRIITKRGGPHGYFRGCENYPMCDFAFSSSDQNVDVSLGSRRKSIYSSSISRTIEEPSSYSPRINKSKTCPHCGKSVMKNASVCHHCGHAFGHSGRSVSSSSYSPVKKVFLECPFCGESFSKSGYRYSKYGECPHCKSKVTPVTANTETSFKSPDVSKISDEKIEILKTSRINKSKICHICENSVMEDESVCPYCGYDFENKSMSKTTVIKEKVEHVSSKFNKLINYFKKNPKITVMILIALIVVGIGILAINAYNDEIAGIQAVKITDISIVNSKTNSKFKVCTVKVEALRDMDNFVLCIDDWTVKKGNPQIVTSYTPQSGKKYSNTKIFEPKNIKKGETYNYTFQFYTRKIDVDSIKFSYQNEKSEISYISYNVTNNSLIQQSGYVPKDLPAVNYDGDIKNNEKGLIINKITYSNISGDNADKIICFYFNTHRVWDNEIKYNDNETLRLDFKNFYVTYDDGSTEKINTNQATGDRNDDVLRYDAYQNYNASVVINSHGKTPVRVKGEIGLYHYKKYNEKNPPYNMSCIFEGDVQEAPL